MNETDDIRTPELLTTYIRCGHFGYPILWRLGCYKRAYKDDGMSQKS